MVIIGFIKIAGTGAVDALAVRAIEDLQVAGIGTVTLIDAPVPVIIRIIDIIGGMFEPGPGRLDQLTGADRLVDKTGDHHTAMVDIKKTFQVNTLERKTVG